MRAPPQWNGSAARPGGGFGHRPGARLKIGGGTPPQPAAGTAAPPVRWVIRHAPQNSAVTRAGARWGRVTPCAPAGFGNAGARGATRPTNRKHVTRVFRPVPVAELAAGQPPWRKFFKKSTRRRIIFPQASAARDFSRPPGARGFLPSGANRRACW